MVVSVLGRNRTTSGSWVVYRRVGFAVQMAWYGAGLRVLGSAMEWLCSVVLGCGWLLRMAWYGARLQVLGSAMEIGETEMRFGDGDWRDRDERWETEEREWDKILLFFYNICYSAILCLELHCNSIAKKFAILTFSILQCRWFWGLKF